MAGRTRRTVETDLVKVAYARDQAEAEFIQGLLRNAEVTSVVRRAPGFDVPDFLAAGPRDVLVAASDVPVARDMLRPLDLGEPRPPSLSSAGRPSRVLAGLLIAVALVGLVVCLGVEVPRVPRTSTFLKNGDAARVELAKKVRVLSWRGVRSPSVVRQDPPAYGRLGAPRAPTKGQI